MDREPRDANTTQVKIAGLTRNCLAGSGTPMRSAIQSGGGSGVSVSKRPEKLIVIGVEGLSPALLDQHADHCPNLARIAERGAVSPITATAPIDPATAWATFGTATRPSTHGCVGLRAYDPVTPVAIDEPSGDPRGDEDDALRTLGNRTDCEWLWQAALRAGRKPVLVDFPGGWPASDTGHVTISGSGPMSSPDVRQSDACIFATREAKESQATNSLRTCPPAGWANPPDSHRAPRETALIITGEADLEPTPAGWMTVADEDGTADTDPSLMYCGLLIASEPGEGEDDAPYDTLIICRGRDAENPVARLGVGEWSDWIIDDLPGAPPDAQVRFKLSLRQLSAGGREISLLRTPLFSIDGWARPAELGDLMVEAALAESLQNAREPLGGIAWMCDIIGESCEWDVLFTHAPSPAGALHELLADGDAAREKIQDELAALDKFVGDVIGSHGDDALVAIVSPYAALPVTRCVWLAKWLIEAGLMEYDVDDASGKLWLDAPNSRAILADHPLAQGVWVNLQGREGGGIVSPEHYESTRSAIISALMSARDPLSGTCPVTAALRREDAASLGLDVDAAADVVYFLAPGYACDPRISSTGLVDASLVNADSVWDANGTVRGAHAPYLPGARLGDCSVDGVLMLAGPSVREGFERRAPIDLTDVAPTLSWVMGFEPPASSEGRVAVDLLSACDEGEK